MTFATCNITTMASVFTCASGYTSDLLGTGIVFVIFVVMLTWLLSRNFTIKQALAPTCFIMFILALLLRLLSLVSDFLVILFGLLTIISLGILGASHE